MNIQATSIEAFKNLPAGRCIDVYLSIELYLLRRKTHPTRQEISRAIGEPINAVTPRVNELLKKNRVEVKGRRKCKVTGSTAQTIGLTNE